MILICYLKDPGTIASKFELVVKYTEDHCDHHP
jgi:hypothetical protein